MEHRVDKYYEEGQVVSRTSRNQELYKQISKTELDNFEVKSNATVIGDNKGNIDVEKIKSILDTHYKDAPKRQSIKIDTEIVPVKKVEETKEYDINVILDKAKEDKEDNYSEERNKKLRNTQFDILNSLDFKEHEENDHSIKEETAKELQNLINTITINEKSLKNDNDDYNPLDLYEDLKSSDKTQTIKEIVDKDYNEITKETVFEEVSKENNEEIKTSMDTSFFTKSTKFNKEDFEDFADIEDGKSSIFVKIIILLLIIAFIAGAIILVKSFL
ncbi:MAG: hypothetical protein ACI4XR_01050 [Bacilli bacterium]